MTSGLETLPIESIIDLCRICETSDVYIDIIDENEQRLAFKYFIITDIEIATDDGLPTTLCKNCAIELKNCFDFKIKCLRSDSKWRGIISGSYLVDDNFNSGTIDDDGENSANLKNSKCYKESEPDSDSDSKQDDELNIPQERKQWYRSKFSCETCKTGFNERDEYSKHIKVHGLRRFQCKNCTKWFKYKFHLELHQRERCIKPRKYLCELCSQPYSSRANLRRHIQEIHEGVKPFECDICGKRFAQKSVLQSHSSVHNSHVRFSCRKCSRQYKTEKSLIFHEQSHLPQELRDPTLKRPKRVQMKICVCTFCGKKSNNQAAHDGHLRTHTKETPYSCKICPKRFKFYSTLRTHKLIHSNEKPYKCGTCGACFRQAAHLKTHNLRHTKERKHVCLICSKAFTLRGNLNTHLKIHAAQSAAGIQTNKEV
ncbi:zinc finger protein OZF-like [Toxorhynchites rutilus septentrionalis]|uniref:zinc finger protein OZF-like n=1 Tax=Toxorhynchites rutilus septentrionalis TaxID=329112 RepID=UPI002478BD7B|nr:zinc finger protein OZF-like [Toxorhynchites rutilus septentrionalis]